MSTQPLITTLEKLLELHKSLHELAVQKTEVVKKGDIESLKNIMKNEQTQLTVIQRVEKTREQEVYKVISGHEIKGEKPTISDCINVVPEQDKLRLKELQAQLLKQLTQIKETNELNQQMIYQSLQFINLSLEMVNPQPQEINYGRPNQQQNQPETRFSAFDSKA